MKKILFLLVALTITVAAQATTTENSTVVDNNIDGSPFAGNYRVSDSCNNGHNSGLATLTANRAYDNTNDNVVTRQVELNYTYMRRQNTLIFGGGYKTKRGSVLFNNIRKITEIKKVDGQVVETKSRFEADSITVAGDLADDDKDGSYRVSFANNLIRINGKDCDQRVSLTPTTDTTP